MTDPPGTILRYAADLFTDDALDDPSPHLRALRDAGPVDLRPDAQAIADTLVEGAVVPVSVTPKARP